MGDGEGEARSYDGGETWGLDRGGDVVEGVNMPLSELSRDALDCRRGVDARLCDEET